MNHGFESPDREKAEPDALRGAFDASATLRKLRHYCRATGVGGHLLDRDGNILGSVDASGNLLEAREGAGACPLCSPAFSQSQGDGAEAAAAIAVEAELRAQLFGAFQAERFGGKYIHLCPHSLLVWTAPVFSDGVIVAALVGGPVLVVDPAEIIADLVASGILPPGTEDAARAVLQDIPRVTPQRATSLAEMLADAAAITGGDLPYRVESVREREDQQARISGHIHALKKRESMGRVAAYPIEKERELLTAISRGDKRESQELLNEILGHIFFSSGQDTAVIRARVLELVVLLSRAALDGGADVERIFGLNFTYLNQIQRMRSVEDIALWLSRIMVRFTDLVFNLKDVKHADVIMKALKYINARYTEPLTLEEVAIAVSLSPTYLSRIFNDEMKCRFTTYLNRLRIQRGKVLLRTTDTSLVDIAGLLGYDDQSYFTKVFKMIVGVSPGRYREAGGRSPRNEEIHED